MKKIILHIIILIFIIQFNNAYTQQKIEGTFCREYGLNDFYNCYTFFNNGEFKFETGGDLGNDYYGKGDFLLSENSLILNYNKSEPKELSYYRANFWKNNKDSIELNFQVMDMEKQKIPYANIVILKYKKGIITNENGNGKMEIKKSNEICEITVSYIGYDECKISLKKNFNYNFKVYLTKGFTGVPIKNHKETLEILELTDKYFKTKSKGDTIIIWNKIE
jgi:hypothetical protein